MLGLARMGSACEAHAAWRGIQKADPIMQDPFDSGSPSSATLTSSSPDRFPDRAAAVSTSVVQPSAAALGDTAQPAASLGSQAKQKLVDTLDSRKGAVADLVAQLAQTVQRSGEQFDGKQDWIASAVGRAAVELNTVAGAIRDKDLGEFASEIGTFARRKPALFIGAALAAGFAVARLGKLVAGDLSRNDLPTMPEVGNGQY